MRRISSSAPTSTLMPSSPSTNGTGISIKKDCRCRQYHVLITLGREASIEYEPCWLAKFFAALYRTVHFLASIYVGCTLCLLSCQGLIVLKYSRDRATWPHCKSGSHKTGIRKSSRKTYNLIMGI